MRVVAVCMVKDEEDVVEAFVRHALAVADHLVVFDHHSTDRTGFLLHRLRADGLPLTVLTDDEFEYRQAARTSALIRLAVAEHGADWVLPLDADEFVQAASPAAFRDVLASRPATAPHPRLPLVNFGPHPADDRTEPNPVVRLRHKVRRVDTGKVAIPRRLIETPGVAVGTGNHDVAVNGTVLPFEEVSAVWLAHFPIRSGWQAAMKVALHETQRAAGGYGGGGTHYSLHFARLLHDPARFMREPEAYLRGEADEPAAYWGGGLRYTPAPDADPQRLTRALLALVQRLAGSHERWRRQAEEKTKPGLLARAVAKLRPTNRNAAVFDFRPADVPDSRAAQLLSGEVVVVGGTVGDSGLSANVRVTNTGTALWRVAPGVGQVNLGVQVADADGRVTHADWHRAALPRELMPGESAQVAVGCPLPPAGQLCLDLVSEGVTWFGLRVPVTPSVTLPAPPSASPDPSSPPRSDPASSSRG